MAEAERTESYKAMRNRLSEKEKQVAKKLREFKEAGGMEIINGFDEKQRERFKHMTNQKQAEYLAKINPSAGKIWGEYAPMLNSKTALEKEVDAKRLEVVHDLAAEEAKAAEDKLNAAKKKLSYSKTKVSETEKRIEALKKEQIQRDIKNKELKAERSKLNKNRMQKGFKEKEAALIRQENVEVKRLNAIPQELKKLEAELTTAKQQLKRAEADVTIAEAQFNIKKNAENTAKTNMSEKSSKEEPKKGTQKKEAPKKGTQKKEVNKKEATKKEVKDNSQKGNHGKEVVAAKKLTSRPRSVPKEVLNEAKDKEGHQLYLEDSKGNRIYMARKGKEPKAKTQSIMTEMKGEKVSEPISVTPKTKDLLNQARRENDKSNSDFSGIIKEMEIERVKDKVKFNADELNLSDITPVPEPEKEPEKKPESKKPESKKLSEPKVELVPHTKKNGKPSKKNFDIVLTDAEGKKVTLTKEKFKEMVSTKGPNSAARADTSWDSMIEAGQKGYLQPEVVASYFKGQVNMGKDEQATVNAAQMRKLAADKGR